MPPDLNGLLDNKDPIYSRRTADADAYTTANLGAYVGIFKDLQSNVITPHGFEQAHYFFLRLKNTEAAAVHSKYFLGMLARDGFGRLMVRNALADDAARSTMSHELIDAAHQWRADAPGNVTEEVHKKLRDLRIVSEYEVYVRRRLKGDAAAAGGGGGSIPPPGSTYRCPVNVLLGRSGYEKLGLTPPPSAAFQQGMAARGNLLEDPPAERWDAGYGSEIDALVIVGHPPESEPVPEGAAPIREILDAFRQIVTCHADIVREEVGTLLTGKDAAGKTHPIEPFGYRDGLSQPAFYETDRVYQEQNRLTGAQWDSFAPLRLALTPDPNGRTPGACGTYFVFRKLEQNIEQFYAQSDSLADGWQAAGAVPRDPTRTGEALRARFIGRELDGCPVGKDAPPTNDFDFSDDAKGVTCPFYAHVRKMNPRSGMRADWGPREHRIVRRGLPYGGRIEREDSGVPKDGRVKYLPGESGPVGLLFLCAQGDIENQFEFLQARWGNKTDHPRGRPWGMDVVIGQGGTNQVALDSTEPLQTTPVRPVVSLKGGDYFFAPSIGCLRGLLDDLLVGDP